MDAEELLKLFDFYWFHHEIFTKNRSSLISETDPVHQIHQELEEPKIFHLPSLHNRSLSDPLLSSKTSFSSESISPNSVFHTQKLQTIFSGKEVREFTDQTEKQEEIKIPLKKVMMGMGRKNGSSKSLPELEFEELKGFMDLGFVFTEDDKNSKLGSIIPGLQRLGKKSGEEEEEAVVDQSEIPRPYLSESWAVLDRRKKENRLRNWKIPSLDAEEVLKLFEFYWFHHEIFTKNPPSLNSETDPVHRIHEELQEPKIFRLPSLHTRSLNDPLLRSKTRFSSESISPNSVLHTPKLYTIFSYKEVREVTDQTEKQEEIEIPLKKVMMGMGRKNGSSKSFSELEVEELKGFMDLGFVFTVDDKNSKLGSIIPGLQRLGKKPAGEEEAVDESAIPRPYLSESWATLDRTKKENRLMNWKIPSLSNEIDMKDHLRCWAHTVASTIR
ncbi:hypothetical protein HHK36_005158 [Tetracentron sinense]|uniref:Uncharacterized protein n=1 Tax=Tetracentron sinense TaxID=13715 RepID=A0A834ZKF3_TETSI|nr:hypothetical protein HHK36_005158 [Tetracentron sinense]